MIMWALGIISLVLLSTGNILFAASSEPTKDHARHPILSRAAKALKKATRSTGNTLSETKNINRGAEGTVVKDMDRGPPLKENLPEDEETDDEWDDQWYEGKFAQIL